MKTFSMFVIFNYLLASILQIILFTVFKSDNVPFLIVSLKWESN